MPRPKIDVERRGQILRALEACALKNGLAKTTLNDVAKEAGLPRPLVRYFMGNRSDMVSALLNGMVERAENQLATFTNGSSQPTLRETIEFLLNKLFQDELSNALIGELWFLAEQDESVRAKLKAVYGRACEEIASIFKKSGVGASDSERKDAAYALVAMSYGHASFEFLGLRPARRRGVADQAEKILSGLKRKRAESEESS